MKRYIGLLALCILSGIAMEQDEQENITLIAPVENQEAAEPGDDKVVVPRDILTKIPMVNDIIKEYEGINEVQVGRQTPDNVKNIGIQNADVLRTVVDFVKAGENVYKNAPIIKKDPQFFEKTDKHRAYTPLDIPEQTRRMLAEELGGQRLQQLLNNDEQREELRKAADFLRLGWIISILDTPEGKSIADLVAYNELPEVARDISGERKLDVSESDVISLAGMHLIGEKLLQTLAILDLSNNYIYSIEQGAFADLYNLKELYLQGNTIRRIKPGDFDGLNKLLVLELNDNRLEDIPQDVFKPLSNLESLDLSANRIRNIEQDGFAGLSSLGNLWLQNNNLNLNRAAIQQRLPEDIRDEVEIYL